MPTQTDLVTADVHANVTINSFVQTISLTTKPLLDCVLGDLQLLGADPAVVVPHAKTIVANHHGRAL